MSLLYFNITVGGIAGEISHINGMPNQMTTTSKQQSSTADEISHNIISINQLAEEASKGTEHIKIAETEIGTVSSRLNATICSFSV